MRAKFSARTGSRMARDPRDGGACAAPDFMRQVWGEMAVLLRPVRCTGRLCLTYAVCNDTALVSAYFARFYYARSPAH